MVTVSKRVLVDIPISAQMRFDAVDAAFTACEHLTLEQALAKGLVTADDGWQFEGIEVEGDDDPPSAMAVAA